MSERKRKRGRPRSTPVLSYSSEMKMRNSITRVIKKPRYLMEQEDESNHNHSRSSCSPSSSSRSSQFVGYDKSGTSHTHSSGGGNSKGRNKRGYNPDFDDKDSEYLYGSDFELEDDALSDDKEDLCESGSGSDVELGDDGGGGGEEEEDLAFTDGEASLSSFSTVSESQVKSCFSSRPQTPIPVWLQDREYPPLELPPSADDLLLPRAYVLKAVSIYEVLRHFRTLVRLSPMRFEDFCAALMVEEQSSLLAEVHLALLKALIREEDSQQTHFGPLDQKDSINVILYFIDTLSWPESLRLYLQSDREFLPTMRILNSCNYPYTSLVNRLQVLQFLCDQFLQTSVVREDLLSEGKLRYDDHCRACHKTGDLLCCDSCSAVYHLDCVDPPLQDIPGEMEDWTCSVCTAHQVEGVTDCISPMETSGNLCRQDPLGFDRHGRKYWFLVRRLFIESEDGEIWYYTTQAQLEEIQSMLDPADLEEDLCNTLHEIFPEMKRHMAVTESLTEENKGTRKTSLQIEDDLVKKRFDERKEKQLEREHESTDKLIEEIKQEVEVKEEPCETNDAPDTSQIKEEPEDSKDESIGHVSRLDPVTGEMIDTSKSGSKSNSSKTVEVKVEKPASGDSKENVMEDNKDKCKKEVDSISLLTEIKIKMSQMNSSTKWYRLGSDGKYKSYVNQYSSNPLALNKLQHNEERDKKRHLSHKFSLTPAAEFKWSGVLYGNKESLISTLRHTILSLEQSISSHLFHPHWSNVRKAWNLAVMSSSEPVNFSKVLMWLVACIKPVVFNSVWHDSLGHVKFNRVTALEREEKKKQEKREKKDPDQEEMRPVTIVKYTLGLKHQVWKLKGEEYRMHAMWGWQWVASHRRTKQVAMSSVGLRAGPDKYMVPIKGAAGLRSLSVNPSIFKQLTLKTPSLKPSLLSPNQLAAEADSSESSPEEKKNEIIIASASGQQKVEVGTVKLEDLFQDGLVNVSQALNSKFRFVYPKVAKASVLDSLLSRRLALRVQEEKDLANKKTQGSDTKGEEEEDEIDVENDDTDATLSDESDHENIDEIPDSQRSTIHKQRPAGNLLKEIRTLKLKYETIDELDSNYSCYSVICRDSERCQCYSPTCLLKMRTKDKLLSSVKNYRIVTSKPAPFDEVGAHSPVRLTNVDAETNSVTKVESVSESVTTTSTSTITSVNGQVVNTSVSNSVEVSQVKSENTDSSDGRSSRASSEIKIRMDEDTDETSQGSISTESKFSLKNNRIYSSESTSGKVYLKKLSSEVKRVKKLQLRIPPLSSFKIGKKTSSLDKRLSSLMVLPKWEIRMLARKGGRYYINGFNHNAKANNSVWPYPCSRPAFKTVWQYRTAIMPTLNSVAMQLRILWVCLRWDDMQEKGPGDGRKQITTDVEIVQTEILKRKHYGRFLERTEYLRRKVTIPFDVPKPVREFTPSQRSGLRKRRRAQSPVNKEPQSVEEWVEEERLDLWEIRFFGERLERAATVSKRSVGERGECIQTVTTRGSSPAEIRARMEEQLKIQRANFNQKKALESTPPGKGGIVRLSICSAGTITTTTGTKLAIPSNPNATTKVVQAGGSTIMAIGGQLPIVSGKKIMTTRDGRIITVQTTQTANSTSVSSQQSSGTTDKSISLGSSTIFPVGGAPKVQVTSQGNKVIRLQAMGSAGSQRMILPRSTNATVVQTRAPRPATPLPTPPSASTNTNTASTPSGTPTTGPRAPGQQIQIIRLPDGQLQVRGLLEGQQLVQRSDGKFQLINKSQLPSNNQSSSTGTATATATSTATSGTGTGTGTSPAIQVTQQTKTVQPSAVSSSSNTVVTPKVNSTAASSTASTHVTNTAGSHVVKVNGMQVLLKQLPEAKQVVTVGASEAAATVSTSSANSVRAGVSQSGHTSPRIKTMLAPDGTMVKTVMSTTSSSSAVSPVTTTAATNSTCTTTSVSGESPVTSSSQNNNNNTTSGSSLTLKVQVRMTEQGPKTIIQGLQPGVGLTKDHIMAIQQQVRNMLAQYNLQVNQLSPVMKLTLHVPNKQSAQPSSTATEPPSEASDEAKKPTPPQTESQQGQGNTNTAIFRNLLSPETQVASQSPAVIAVKNASAEAPNLSAGGETEASEPAPAAQSPPEDGLLSPNPANKEFVLTQEYIQQAIKSVLSRDDLNPEVEEKLMQLQKYNIEQTKKDEPPVPVSGPNTSATPNSTARNSAVKRIRDPDDSDWDPIEEKSATVVTVTPPKPRPKKPRPESRQADTAKPKKSTVKNEALDIRKKQALQHKLESLMTRHKDFLKKDILKKRAQLEKELQVEIHKELSVARVQLQMLEKNKTDSSLPSPVLSPRKKKTISESSPSQVVSPGTNQLSPETSRLTHTSSASQNNVNSNKNSSLSKSPSSKPSTKSASAKKASKNKNKKIVCICRTPFDDTKFYVGCDLCGNWFHGDCVGITEAMSRSMTEYVCDDCANAKLNKELFCFCRQPYDETQFYICCEQCEDWYHGKCVGIMQSEADDIDDYICPKCDSNNVWNYPCQKTLSSKDYVEIKKLTKGLIQHKNAWPFLEPVDPSEVPDYYKVVKEPMDLKTVENRVETKSYPRLAQFIGDVMLVFDNCRLYNPPNSSFCSCAATLESFFCQKLRSLKTRLSQR